MDYKDFIDREQLFLRTVYDGAKRRMEYHAEYAEKCRNIVLECPRFESEIEAMEMVIKIKKEYPEWNIRVWVSIEKDEEFYRFNAPWLVTTTVEQLLAAEYIGMACIEDYDIFRSMRQP